MCCFNSREIGSNYVPFQGPVSETKNLAFLEGPKLLHILWQVQSFLQALSHKTQLAFFGGSLKLALSIMRPPSLAWKRVSRQRVLVVVPPQSLRRSLRRYPFFYWALVVQASLDESYWEVRVISPSLVPSRPLPPWPIFLFFSTTSPEDTSVRAGVGSRGTTKIAGEAPLAWAVSNAKRFRVFSSNIIPSGILVSSWLVLT